MQAIQCFKERLGPPELRYGSYTGIFETFGHPVRTTTVGRLADHQKGREWITHPSGGRKHKRRVHDSSSLLWQGERHRLVHECCCIARSCLFAWTFVDIVRSGKGDICSHIFPPPGQKKKLYRRREGQSFRLRRSGNMSILNPIITESTILSTHKFQFGHFLLLDRKKVFVLQASLVSSQRMNDNVI